MANSVDPDQTPQNAASDQSTLFALSSEIAAKHSNTKILPDTTYIGNELVQRVEVEKFTWHKWVKITIWSCYAACPEF